jgi:hypothetical protein
VDAKREERMTPRDQFTPPVWPNVPFSILDRFCNSIFHILTVSLEGVHYTRELFVFLLSELQPKDIKITR